MPLFGRLRKKKSEDEKKDVESIIVPHTEVDEENEEVNDVHEDVSLQEATPEMEVDEDVDERDYLQKEPSIVNYVNEDVVDLSGEQDFRQHEDDVYVVKKKLGRFREIIIDVLEYFPSRDDIKDNYIDTFGGGAYKIFVGNTRLKLKKIAVYKFSDLPAKNFSLSDAEKIESQALKKWEEMRREMNQMQTQPSINPLAQTPQGMYLPRTPEEVAYMFLNSEKERLMQEVKHKEEIIQNLQKEKDELQKRLHELELEIVKNQGGGSVMDKIKELRTTAEVLGWQVGMQNQSAILQVLNSPVGQQLIQEVDKITDLLEKRWEINEWEKRISKLKEKRTAPKKPPAKINKPTQVKKQTGMPSKEKLVNKLYELMKQRVPKDVCELAIDVSLKYSQDRSVKGILRNAVKVIIAIQKAQDAATAIDNFVLSGRMTPEEAAAWIVEHEPAYAQQLAQMSYDELLEQIKPFSTNPHIKPLIEYYEQPEVKKAIEEVIAELKKIYSHMQEMEKEVSLAEGGEENAQEKTE